MKTEFHYDLNGESKTYIESWYFLSFANPS